MAPKRRPGVLVVDDADDTRELFAEVLMHEGYHSIMARNGREALARLQYVRPELIISDLAMPEMDGAELVRRLKADPRYREIPIVILTGSGKDKALHELGETAGRVRAVLTKPISVDDLLNVVDRTLAGD